MSHDFGTPEGRPGFFSTLRDSPKNAEENYQRFGTTVQLFGTVAQQFGTDCIVRLMMGIFTIGCRPANKREWDPNDS